MGIYGKNLVGLDNKNAIKADNIKRYFSSGDGTVVHALDGVSLEIKKGTLAILKGRSGSGKTTLLNILSALDMPTSGSVEFMGRLLEDMTEKDRELLRRYEMGFVFQSIALIPTMTAYENVEFALRLAGKRDKTGTIRQTKQDKIKEEIEKEIENETITDRVTQLLDRVGLSKRMHHMPQQLSGGEQQRVAIARAVAHHPKLVFADEPTGALDTAAGLEVMRLFRELIDEEDITIIMTTHDPNLMELGDEVFELSDGRIVKR